MIDALVMGTEAGAPSHPHAEAGTPDRHWEHVTPCGHFELDMSARLPLD
jgi:hypothetical protein